MFKWILFTFLTTYAFALEISVESAKDDYTPYSVINVENSEPFSCQEVKNNFDVTIKIICAFSKRPSESIKAFENDFFKVHALQKKEHFFLIIKPTHQAKLFSNIFNLTQDNTVFDKQASSAKIWNIVGYDKKIPLLHQEKSDTPTAIDFPFYLDKDKIPYVGSLDLRGNPVKIKKVEDVKEYLQVKKEFDAKQYENALDTIDDILQTYPHTLFKEELLYYKIKSYNQLKNWESVIEDAKTFLREYSSSDHIPEVLSLIAKGYAKMSQSTDADYFFDRLFSEHPKSLYTQWGYIYKGDMLADAGGNREAKKYYIRALRQTKNLEVAATAAFRLANLLSDGSLKEAALYIMKIVHADPKFFAKHLEESQKLMQKFADNSDYKTAAAMAAALLQGIDPSYDEYETLLKDKALWLTKTKDKKAAFKALEEYMKKFPDGDYIETIEKARDALFFDVSDLNASAKLDEYNKLIEEYANQSIAKRALYEKAKVLLTMHKYKEVLALKGQLLSLEKESYPKSESIIKKAATALMQSSLQKKNCLQVLSISQEYNITLSDRWDDGVYNCAMQGGDFSLSKTIALKRLKVKDVQARKKWLYRYIKVEFATGNYTDVIDAAKDLITLIANDKKSPYINVYRILFDAYSRVENRDGMIQTMLKLEKIFGLDYKDIDRYVAMINLANGMHDDNMLIKYATKVMKLQEQSHSYAQSPYVEFALYQAYMNKEDYTKAYEVIKSLDSVDLNAADRARQKYLLGTVLSKLWRDEEAKKAYKAAIKADKNSSWAKLAQSALEIG